MAIELKVPEFPESVDEGTLITWYKQDGEAVTRDEKLADVETDKVVLEVYALDNGTLSVAMEEGSILRRGDVLGSITSGAGGAAVTPAAAPAEDAPADNNDSMSPSVRKLIQEKGIDASAINGTGKNGRITKKDVEAHLNSAAVAEPAPAPVATPAPAPRPAPAPAVSRPPAEGERRVPMSQLRMRIAQRLVEVQQSAAILTTFNEVDMKPIMDMRALYKDKFQEEYGVKLGFMSFFVKAATEALKKFPEVNGQIDGRDIVYHEFVNVGIAVDSPRGLVVPVVQDTDALSFAEVESSIRDFAMRAKDNKLQYEELIGGTFTITNGGTFGSMLSTPILNAPQSAILGMHTIQQRPVAVDGEVVIRPMMYLALSYDHRIIDGRTAVQFLVSMKEMLEDPNRLMLQL